MGNRFLQTIIYAICFILGQLFMQNWAQAGQPSKKIVRISYSQDREPQSQKTSRHKVTRGPGSERVKPQVVKVHYTQGLPERVVVEPLAKNANTKNLGLPKRQKKHHLRKSTSSSYVLAAPKPLSSAELERRRQADLKKLQESSEKDLLSDYDDI